MAEAFGWISKIIDAILSFIPRIVVIRCTHRGVSFKKGRPGTIMNPGLHVWFPLWTDLEIYPIVRQTMNLPQQTITTYDDQQIQINTIVVFRVSDIVTAFTLQWDFEETIRDICQTTIRSTLTRKKYATIMSKADDIDALLTETLKDVLLEYGVEVLKVGLSDCVRTQTYTLAALGTIAETSNLITRE